MPISQATKPSRWYSQVSPCWSMYDMSPGREWASTISPPPDGAVNVFMKNDSPESERLSPLRMPPCVDVSIWVPAVMLSIAPPSQRICSPAAILTTATVKAGAFSNVDFHVCPPRCPPGPGWPRRRAAGPPRRFIGHGTLAA